MRGMNNTKLTEAQQAKSVYIYKNLNSCVLHYEGHWLDNKLIEKKN
jgi:hypothetical protein